MLTVDDLSRMNIYVNLTIRSNMYYRKWYISKWVGPMGRHSPWDYMTREGWKNISYSFHLTKGTMVKFLFSSHAKALEYINNFLEETK